jgi:TonB family protein
MTLSFHAAVIYLMTANWTAPAEEIIKPRVAPRYVEARLVTADSLKPKPKPRPKAKPKAAAPKPKPKAAPPKAAPAKPSVESKPAPAPEPKPVVPAGPTEQERVEAARDELALAMEAEDEMLEQASDNEVAQSYVAHIARIIENNWSRPPSARNDMEAELVIQLIPTGEVVSVSVARSSGNVAFDRSAVMAVQKAERFPELQNLPSRIFNKDFRTLRLKFKPEDLRY